MKATIAVLPGDGIGPEVARERREILAAVGARGRHEPVLEEPRIGGALGRRQPSTISGRARMGGAPCPLRATPDRTASPAPRSARARRDAQPGLGAS